MLENYYQNIRQYVKSVDINQFSDNNSNINLAAECEPFRYKIEKSKKINAYEPCGAISNSLFNGNLFLTIFFL